MKEIKPTHFLVLKLVGLVAAAVAVTGFVLLITGFGKFESNRFMLGGIMMSFGLVVALPCLLLGFAPELAKLRTRSARYIQDENREDLTELATASAEIASEAIATAAAAARKGLDDTVFCRHCGKRIAADSKFCPSCGKEQ